MKVISNTLNKYLIQQQANCKNFNDGVCKAADNRCLCRIRADVWAHCEIIPEHLRRKTLNDFTGMSSDQVVIPPKVVEVAREQIKKYCWDGLDEGAEYDESWIVKSVMPKRLRNGNNLIIYGDSWTYINQEGQLRAYKRQIGRTLVAAVVLKEAISQRVRPEHISDTYEWVPYNLLCNRLIAQAGGSKDYDDVIADYEEADWLVVDGLELIKGNEGGRAYRASVLDKLFGERIENHRPSILVFQDDISKLDDIQRDFGNSINSIINSRKTFKVEMKA